MNKRRWGLAGGIVALGAAAAIYASLSSKPPPSFYFSGYASGIASGQDMCDVAQNMGLLTCDYFCLRGDGGSVSAQCDGGTAMNLSAVGAPATQTLTQTPCGPDGCAVTGQRLRQDGGVGEYWKTAATTSPATDSVGAGLCLFGSSDSFATEQLHGKWQDGNTPTVAFAVDVLTTGVPKWYTGNGATATTLSGTATTAGAVHLVCGTYQRSADAGTTNSTVLTYLDGVAGATDATQALMQANNIAIAVGASGSGAFKSSGRFPGALWMSSPPASAQIQALASSLGVYAPSILQGSRGEAITFTRASAATCTASDGTVSVLPPGRPCVTSGGYLSEPAGTNMQLWSERTTSSTQWSENGGAANGISTDYAVAPDGTQTADRLTFVYADGGTSALSLYAVNISTTNGSPVTISAWVKGNGDAGTIYVGDWNANSGSKCTKTACSYNATNYTRCSHTYTADQTTSSEHAAWIGYFNNRGCAAGSVEPADVSVWGKQYEAGSVATSYVPTQGATAARAATTATFANPLAGLNPASWCIGARAIPSGAAWGTGGGSVSGIWGLGATYGGANSAALYVLGGDSKLHFETYDSGGTLKYWKTTSTISTSGADVMACSNSGVPTFYINGVLDAAVLEGGGGTGIITTQPATVRFGGMKATDYYLNGRISNVQILSRGSP